MKTKLPLLLACLLLAGCTTITREVVHLDGTISKYRIDSIMNRKTLAGLTFEDNKDGTMMLKIESLTSDQAKILDVADKALQAYLMSKGAGAP